MKTFTKHILLLALMLFGVAGAAWALPERAPQKWTGPVDIYSLVQGDTLAPGFSLTYGHDQSENIYFANGRYSENGTTQATPYNGVLTDPDLLGISFTASNIIFHYAQEGFDTIAPMVDMNTPGNAWVVSDIYRYVEGVELTLSGIEIVIDYPVQDANGNWNFLMPGANKVVKAVLYDSIVLGPHVEIYDAQPAFAAGDIYTRGDSTIYYYDTNNHHSFNLRADEQADGKYFGYWADLDPTDPDYNNRTYRYVGPGFLTCGHRYTAAYPENHTLTLVTPQGGGTLSLDGYTPGTLEYNEVTIPSSWDGQAYQVTATDLDADFTPISHSIIANYRNTTFNNKVYIFYGINAQGQIKYAKFKASSQGGAIEDSNTVFKSFVYSKRNEYRFYYTKATPEVIPYGISKTGDNTYSVMEGLTVNVTATPDSAHYLARIDGLDTMSNAACGYSFTMPGNDYPLMADFTTKPTLTLAQTDGGTLEAIVPQGGPVTYTGLEENNIIHLGDKVVIPSTINSVRLNNASNLNKNHTYELIRADITWNSSEQEVVVSPAEDGAYYVFKEEGSSRYVLSNFDGDYHAYDYRISVTAMSDGLIVTSYDGYQGGHDRYTIAVHEGNGTSAPTIANVIASSTPNTYYIDYGTPVTVVATPDAQHYLVSFSDDAPATERNSNLAVEKRYDSVIADIPDLSANFQAKPTLTLTANNGGTLTLDGVVEPGATGTTFDVPGNWSNNQNPPEVSDFPGFVAVSLEEASNWQPPVSGNYKLYYNIVGEVQYCVYYYPDGSRQSGMETYWRKNLYNYQNNGGTIAYTTGAIDGMPAGVVSANATRDTFVVDYGTDVTVVATPDSIHYLATLGGVTLNSNTAKDTTFAVTATTNLAANFAQKPTLTLAHNDGGEMEVIPAGSATAMHITTDQIPTWSSNNEPVMEADLQPFGFVAVDSAAAAAWTGAPASGVIYLLYAPAGNKFKVHVFQNGQWSQAYSANYSKGSIYRNLDKVYFTTGATSNVTASTEPNTYYIDYNTSVTVKATPSDTAYLVRFVGDADTNSNTAVEKTYGPLTAALTTAEATFNDKPVLTLAQGRALVSDDPDAWGNVTLGGDDLPAGVAQLTDNTYRVDYGTEVTLIADATELHHVANWVNEDSVAYPAADITYSAYFITDPVALFPDSSTLTLTLTADTTAKAIFGINSYDVFASVDTTEDLRGTVNALYTDIDGNPQTVGPDDTITLTAQGGSTTAIVAVPTEPGYHFEYWTDTLGTEIGVTDDTLRVTDATAVIAVFDTNVYQISATVADGSTEWGTVTGSGDYRHFTQATLEALPIEHYHFVKWEDGNTENPRVIDVTGPESHQAEFAIDRFIVSWSSNDTNMGVVVNPYDNHSTGTPIPRLRGAWGTSFQLVAQAKEHHMLDHWSTGQTSDTITHVIEGDTHIVAFFKHVPYSITVLSADETMGTATGDTTLEWQTSTTITATANYGYHFTQWNDGNTTNPRTVTNDVEGDQTFTASFAKNIYTITAVSDNTTMGTVTGTTTAEYLDEVEIKAIANEHYHFVQWADNNTHATRTVTVEGNATYTAIFAPNKYTVVGVANEGLGTVEGSGSYDYLSNAVLTAIPTCGYIFDHWSNESTDGTISVSVTGDTALTAFFRPSAVEVVHDTVTINDTTTIEIHDTTVLALDTIYINVPDTNLVPVTVFDTTTVPVTVMDTTLVPVTVMDTTIVPVTVIDSTLVPVIVPDTTFVPVTVMDTTHVDVFVNDTVLVPVTWYDTTHVDVVINDTTHVTVFDSVVVTVPVFINDTTIVPVTVMDTTLVPVYEYDTTHVDVVVVDSTLVPVHDTVIEYVEVHDTLWLVEYIHDTVYIHDTIYVDIDNVDALEAKIYANNGQIVVEGADGNDVVLYDVTGRILATKRDEYAPLRFDIQVSGTYLVKIGNHPARRIVMIR